MKRIPLATLSLALTVTLAVLMVSCQDSGPGRSAVQGPTTVPTVWSQGVGPTTKVAQDLGFRHAPAKEGRTVADVRKDNAGCVTCHDSDAHTMHVSDVKVSCVDCHGGKPETVAFPQPLLAMFDGVSDATAAAKGYERAVDAQRRAYEQLKKDDEPKYHAVKRQAHVLPKLKEFWPESGGNPQISGVATLAEDVDFVRFINPGDLRAAQVACAACHPNEARNVPTSMMAHGAMLWGAALYNNGSYNTKDGIYGEGYSPDGKPARILPATAPTTRQAEKNGMLVELWPMLRWEISQPGNILRVFERGAKSRPIIGIPNSLDDSGKPEVKLSLRGLGTDVRTDPVTIGLQKTRLLDPTLNFMGSNDHPGDYRASGCSACHVVYANDRSPVHSMHWAKYGNRGKSFSKDTTVNEHGHQPDAPSKTGPTARASTQPATPLHLSEGGLSVGDVAITQDNPTAGHPIEHRFVRSMPTSTCIVCHIHPGTNVLNSYLGFMWWDNESDAEHMYPAKQKNPTPEDEFKTQVHNPEGSAVKGLWSNLYPGEKSHAGDVAPKDFLEQVGSDEFNAKLKRVQFADFHGHGWIFRAVFKQDRHGHLLDAAGKAIDNPSADAMMRAVKYMWDPRETPEQSKKAKEATPVHLKDIHLEKGMQCVDCHFSQDNHGDGNLYGETRNAVMVECIDCHGDVGRDAKILSYLKADADGDNKAKRAALPNLFTGKARPSPQMNVTTLVGNHFGFSDKDARLWQKSAVYEEQFKIANQKTGVSRDQYDADADKAGTIRGWYVTPVTDRPSNDAKDSDERKQVATAAAWAHTVRKDAKSYGMPSEAEKTPEGREVNLAHSSNNVSCYACHSSWNTSCFGCHLPQRANQRRPMLHNEGAMTRNYTNYNYQTLRDDVYMLGVDSSVKGNKVVPIRSACAVMVSSQDANRQSLYTQQQTISGEGYAGTAFSPYFPHTVRTTETKRCNDCHTSKDANGLVDNNAVIAQLMLQGTNSVNFIGKWAWVAEGKGGLEAVQVTEQTEPQAVIGSTLHKWAYPDNFRGHNARGKELAEHHHHDGTVLDLQARGEYLYAACGKDGFIAYDIANIDNKGFSERIITSPVSPLGQRLYVKSRYATSICSPSTLALDPTRDRLQYTDENGKPTTVTMKDASGKDVPVFPNREGRITPIGKPDELVEQRGIHLLYAFLYMTDAEEGLIVIGNPLTEKRNKPGVATLLDGDPENNFIDRAKLTMPDGTSPNAFNPGGLLKGARHMALHGHHAYVACDAGVVVIDLDNPLAPRHVATLGGYSNAKRIAFQFRYAFVVDDRGLSVLDVTDVNAPKPVGSLLELNDARDVYVSRTYAYVAGGKNGMYIIDVERPERPTLFKTFNADGALNDTRAVRIGMTNSSMFAYVADGVNGLAVVQLTSPDDNPTYMGFAPTPQPVLVARHKTRGPALAISEGLDRDRAVDEAGHQLSVFGRKGARPFTLAEMQRLYLKDGQPFFVTTTPPGPAITNANAPTTPEKPAGETPAGPKKIRPRPKSGDE